MAFEFRGVNIVSSYSYDINSHIENRPILDFAALVPQEAQYVLQYTCQIRAGCMSVNSHNVIVAQSGIALTPRKE